MGVWYCISSKESIAYKLVSIHSALILATSDMINRTDSCNMNLNRNNYTGGILMKHSYKESIYLSHSSRHVVEEL